MKMAGCNTEEEFYQKYPSEKDFFAAYPHMKGNQTMKMGGAASGHPGSYWNGDQWVSSAGDSGTYANGVYYATGGPVFMPGGSAPIFGMGGAASFNISNNEYPTPFAMAPGTGRGGGYLQDLPTHMAHGGPIPGAEIVDPFAMYPGTGKGGGMLQDLPVEMKKGGIHIAPSKRGTFTAAATKHGKSVQAFASQVLANKENYSPAMVKKANFARNAAKWKHEYGGMYQDGGPLLPNNPSGYVDSVINANQESPFYKDLKAGRVPKNVDFFQNDNSHEWDRKVEDLNNPYVGNSTDFLPHGSYIGYNQWGTGRPAMYMRIPQDQSVNPVSRMYIGAGPDNVIKFPSKTAANIFQQEIEKRISSGKKTKEYGGSTIPDNPGFRALPPAVQQKIMDNMQTGGMVTADRVVYGPGGQYMEQGGMVNPYHPMAKFMRGGYYQNGGQYNVGQYVPGLGYWNGSTFQATNPKLFAASNMGEAEEYPSEMPTVPSPMPKMENFNKSTPTEEAVQQTPNSTTTNTTSTNTTDNSQSDYSGWDKTRDWSNAILGTGMAALGVASAFADRRDARNLRNKQFNDRSSANMYAAVNQPGGKGDYTQQGVFRPDSMTPTAAGKFYPGMPGSYNQGMGITAKMGGVMNNYTFAHGGYHVGQELELSDAEIANLKRMGYKFDIL
jgi:hypothetical protein